MQHLWGDREGLQGSFETVTHTRQYVSRYSQSMSPFLSSLYTGKGHSAHGRTGPQQPLPTVAGLKEVSQDCFLSLSD